MKAKFYSLVFVLLWIHCLSLAQVPNLQLSSNNGNQSYVQAFVKASDNLQESRIPYGVLYDKVFGWAGMSIWQNGDTTSQSHVIQTWWDLENSRINPTGYTFENMKSATERLKAQQKIAVISFNYNFGYIDTMAYYDGRMQVVNNELVDAGGPSPYIAKNVTFAGLNADSVIAGSNYTLESSFSFMLANNTQHTINGYTIINATDNTQYTLSANSNLPLNFSTPGLNFLQIATHTTVGDFSSVQAIDVLPGNQSISRHAIQNTAEPVHELLTSDIPFQGYNEAVATTSYADFHIYYHYANPGDTNTSELVLRKPLIMIDGFDPGDERNYEEIYNDMLTYSGGHLGKELRKKGYDLIILNFPVAGTRNDEQGKTNIDIPLINGSRRDGGTDYIERNAFLLVKLIQTINERLRQNGSNEKLVIVGPSMGGQISRYALAYMERKDTEGVDGMKHNTKLWISFDSPHEGANIPLAGQRSMIYLGFITGNQEARQNYFSKLGNPASKQMLIEQFDVYGYENGSGGFYDYNILTRQNGSSTFHQTYYNNLKSNGISGSNGWPTQLKKIALVNGADNGAKTWTENQEFLNVVGRVTFLNIRVLGMYCNFLPVYGQTNRIFRGWRSSNFEDDFYVTNINPKGSMDNVPGGLFNTTKELQKGYAEGFSKVRPFKVKPIWYTLLDYNSFIPTISALGFKSSNFDWSQPINNRNLVQTGEIYFDDYFAPTTNEEHITLTAANVAWLNTWLEKVKDDTIPPAACPIIWSQLKLSGPRTICSQPVTYTIENIPNCANVTWTIHPDLNTINEDKKSITVQRLYPLETVMNGWIQAHIEDPNTLEATTLTKRNITIWKPGLNNTDTLIYGHLDEWGGDVRIPDVLVYDHGARNIVWKASDYWEPIIQGDFYTRFSGREATGPVTISAELINSCGEATQIYRTFFKPEFPYYYIYSDSTTGKITITLNDKLKINDKSKKLPNNKDLEFDQIVILDAQRNIKYKKSFYKSTSYLIDANQIPNGIYTIQILSEGKVIEEKLIRIKK